MVAQVGIYHQRRHLRLLVQDEFLSATLRSRVLAMAGVPVVEQHQRRVVDIAHVVLVREPRGWGRGIDPEIAARPQPPRPTPVPKKIKSGLMFSGSPRRMKG
jgi:hypothetical protein